MQNVPHVLSPDDSKQAEAFAQAIHQRAERTNRQVVSRYGMDIFQGVKSTLTLELDCLVILSRFPGVFEYIIPFANDDARCTAFERAIALNVHLITVQRHQPVVVLLELDHA